MDSLYITQLGTINNVIVYLNLISNINWSKSQYRIYFTNSIKYFMNNETN